MIPIRSFMKIGSTIRKLIRGYTHRQHGDLISLLSLFQNKESRIVTANPPFLFWGGPSFENRVGI
jgi:hypothetical protein